MQIDIDKLHKPPSEDYSELTFGDRLRAVREARGIKIGELAERSGIHRNIISNYERGVSAPNITSLEWLCKALGVSASELLGF